MVDMTTFVREVPLWQMNTKTPRKGVGFSLSPEMVVKVKEEAARRGLPLRKLLEEMWATYNKAKRDNASQSR